MPCSLTRMRQKLCVLGTVLFELRWRETSQGRGLGRLPLAHSGSDRPAQLLRKPQFNERLSCYPEPARFPVEGVHHPSGEIHIDSFRVSPDASSLEQREESGAEVHVVSIYEAP